MDQLIRDEEYPNLRKIFGLDKEYDRYVGKIPVTSLTWF